MEEETAEEVTSSAIVGLAFFYKVINVTLLIALLTINHTSKDIDLIDATIELIQAGGSR